VLTELDEFEATYNAEYKEHAAIAKELAETKAEFASYEVSKRASTNCCHPTHRCCWSLKCECC
jgi:hypothetical protein